MNKKLCLLLTAVLLLCSAAGCSEKQSDGGTDTPADPGSSQVTVPEEVPETEEEKITAESTLTVEDFGGRDYRMISTNQDNRQVDIIA